MKRLKLNGLLLAMLSMLSVNTYAQDGWTTLFNGKDFTGWFETDKGINGKHKWEVKDRMIIGTTVPGQANSFLVTEKQYGDFVLELEVSVDTLMNNSGIQFRSLSYPDYNNWRLHGYQVEVDPKPQQWSGAIYEEGANRGWIYGGDELSPAAKKAFKRDTRNGYSWNKYRIEAVGNVMRTWVNGVPAANLVDDRYSRGHIGIQIHANQANDPAGSYKLRVRNVRIQTGDLKLSPMDDVYVSNFIPNYLSAQEEKNGFSFLWDGLTTNGWLGPDKSAFPKDSWSIKNGELSTLKSPDGNNAYLISEKTYKAFELKFDFKVAEGANSGVKYFVNESAGNKTAALSALEFQVVDNAGVTGNRILASLADIKEAGKPFVQGSRKPGEWNRALIRVLPDNTVQHFLNGSKVLEYQRGSSEFKDLVSKSKYKDIPNFGMSSSGHILLENNGSAVAYRSLKIRELK